MPPYKIFVFDAYGTLFDVNSAVARCREEVGPAADRLSELWQRLLRKQLLGFTDSPAAWRRYAASTASKTFCRLPSIALFTAEPGTTWKIGAVAKPYFPASAFA